MPSDPPPNKTGSQPSDDVSSNFSPDFGGADADAMSDAEHPLPDFAAVRNAIRRKTEESLRELEQSVTADKFRLIQAIQALEGEFVEGLIDSTKQQWDEFEESDWRSCNPRLTNPNLRGFNKRRQAARARDSTDILQTPAFIDAKRRRGKLYEKLYSGIMALTGGSQPSDDIPLSQFSI